MGPKEALDRPAHDVVLYRDERGWRYAVYAEGGVFDGRLPDIPVESVEQAPEELLRRVE